VTLVVKIGGSTLKEGVASDLIRDLGSVHTEHGAILVHGGAPEVTKIAKKMGNEPKFVVSPGGMRSRYTDQDTIETFTMVMAGSINKRLVSCLQREGIPAFGLSGMDGMLLKAERKKRLVIVDERGRKRIIDGGYTGKIKQVETGPLRTLLDNGYLPVVAPVAIGSEYEHLNVDGDRAAAYIAGALKAEALIFLTDVPCLQIDGKPVSSLKIEQARTLLPKIGHGMQKKVYASIEAVEMSVKKAIISSAYLETPVSSALSSKAGTVITDE